MMQEISLNLHVHSYLSDGFGTYQDIANAAHIAGVDVVIVTDHNVHVKGLEGWYQTGDGRVLMLSGLEVHDQSRDPQKNHLLVFNPQQDFSRVAHDPQLLVDRVNKTGGLSFLAHPHETQLPSFGEPDISWIDLSIHGMTGIELWNGLSEIKRVSHSGFEAVFYAFFPQFLAHSPSSDTIALWDQLTQCGKRITAIVGSDAHNLKMHLGPITKHIYPYEYHFSTINNHLLLPSSLGDDIAVNKALIYQALKMGNLFIGYDLPARTTGFHFSAQCEGSQGSAMAGDEIELKAGVTFQIRSPQPCKLLLFRNGEVIQRWKGDRICTYTTNKPGVYRIEAWIEYLGERRGWVFTNPIYVRKA